MTKVMDVLAENDRPIPSVGPDATVIQAARLMNDYKVGALVVCESGVCRGIFTERDLLRCFASHPDNLPRVLVATVMSEELLVCTPDTDIDEARRVMVFRHIRNLPVVDEKGKLIGLISLSDLDAHDFDGQAMEIHYLKKYIYGRN